MKNVLQCLVKVIIVGSLSARSSVFANRQFLSFPPPIPYYQNPDIYIPAHHELSQPYYSDQNAQSTAVSYQNMNFYAPQQLFRQNDDFHPPELAHSDGPYQVPTTASFEENYHTSYVPPLGANFDPRIRFNQPPLRLPKPSFISPRKPVGIPTTIILKDDNIFQDDFSKHYQEDDYSELYSDDTSGAVDPCIINPYRYLNPVKPGDGQNHPPCLGFFQPNFNSKIYGLKTPLNIIPSRFPPRIEDLINRIQNYFSTYTQQGVERPGFNQTKPQTTSPPSMTPGSHSESEVSAISQSPDSDKKNTTVENHAPGDFGDNTTPVANSENVSEVNNSENSTESQSLEGSNSEESVTNNNEHVSPTVDSIDVTEEPEEDVTIPVSEEAEKEVTTTELGVHLEPAIQVIIPLTRPPKTTTEENVHSDNDAEFHPNPLPAVEVIIPLTKPSKTTTEGNAHSDNDAESITVITHDPLETGQNPPATEQPEDEENESEPTIILESIDLRNLNPKPEDEHKKKEPEVGSSTAEPTVTDESQTMEAQTEMVYTSTDTAKMENSTEEKTTNEIPRDVNNNNG